jgi:hypothetical protein
MEQFHFLENARLDQLNGSAFTSETYNTSL